MLSKKITRHVNATVYALGIYHFHKGGVASSTESMLQLLSFLYYGPLAR